VISKHNSVLKIWAFGIFILLAILDFFPAASASRLPDTLRFGDVAYIKRVEKLYHNKARLILINEKQQTAFVMAELFEKHVSFLNPAGNTVKTDSFPQPPSFAYSKTGSWLYLWGRKNDANYYYRIYGANGDILFEKSLPPSGSEPSTGTPLENITGFIKTVWPEGVLALVDSAGDMLYSARPLEDNSQANFLFDTDLNENAIFVAASPGDYTEFISYNGHLVEQKRTTLPLNGAFSISASDDGRFAMVNFYDTGEGWPLVVMSATGQNLYQVPFPKTYAMSSDANYLGLARANNELILLKTDSWETIVRVDSAAVAAWTHSGSWKNIEFSDDTRYMLALSDGVLLCIDILNRTWKALDFPYAFWQARLLNKSTDLYLTGDYGWVLYKKLK
jgi:hypothetical protein